MRDVDSKQGSLVLVATAAVFLGLVDAPRAVSVGSFTLLGLGTALIFALMLLAGPVSLLAIREPIAAGSRAQRAGSLYTASRTSRAAVSAFVAFALWAFCVSVVRGVSGTGVQNLLVYGVFVGAVVLSYRKPWRGSAARVLTTFCYASWWATVVYLLSVAVFGFGTDAVLSARAYALAALIMLACSIPSKGQGGIARFLPLFLFIAIVSSLSRTTTVLAALLLLGLSLRAKATGRRWRVLGIGATLAGALFWALNYFPPLRDRFSDVGDNSTIAGVQLNTSGRTDFWSYLYDRAFDNTWTGHGAGQASDAISAAFGPLVSHPHNDYLRMFYDFGLVGFILGSLALLCALGASSVGWVRSTGTENESLHAAAVMSSLCIMLAMLTDNVIVYVFVMLPYGVLIGNSMARVSVPNETNLPYESAGTPTQKGHPAEGITPSR